MNINQERQEKAAALQGLAANFGKNLDTNLLKLWLRLLEPYTVEAVNEAVLRVIENYDYKTLPPFAVLKKHLDGGRTQEQTLAMKAEAEWDLLLDNIGRFGWAREPDTMHPTTAHVLRAMGGWQAACSWETSSLEWKHKDFVERWQQADGNLELMQGGALAIEAHIKRRIALKSVDEAMGLPRGSHPRAEEIRTQWEHLLAEEQRLQQGLAMAQAGR